LWNSLPAVRQQGNKKREGAKPFGTTASYLQAFLRTLGIPPAKSREVVPVQPVDATPLWSVDLTTRFKGPILSGRGSLLPKQDGVFLR
jgi:hypothetical protein